MGFGIKIFPGVRVRASTKSVGLGVGPFSASTRIRGGGRRRSYGSSRTPAPPSAATVERQRRRYAAEDAEAALYELIWQHRGPVKHASRPLAEPKGRVDEAKIYKEEAARATLPLAIWQRSARRSAREEAAKKAEQRILADKAAADKTLATRQAELDRKWVLLEGGDPIAVRDAVTEALGASNAGQMTVAVDGNVVRLVLRTGSLEQLIPADRTDLTPGGKPTVKRRTKTDRNLLFGTVIHSQALSAIRTVFASAPSVSRVEVAVVMRTSVLTPLFAVALDRASLARVGWHKEPIRIVLNDIDDCDVRMIGRTYDVASIEMEGFVELRGVLDEYALHYQLPVDYA